MLSVLVRFTLNSSTRIIEFRGFLSRFSTIFFGVLVSILEVRPN